MPREGQHHNFAYAVVRSTRKIHKYPGKEQCNLDDVLKGNKGLRSASFAERHGRGWDLPGMQELLVEGWTLCEHCFPESVSLQERIDQVGR